MIAQRALKYDIKLNQKGRLELDVPFPSGTHVIVFVIETPEDQFNDLLLSAETSLEFWDNPYDDEDWNHVSTG